MNIRTLNEVFFTVVERNREGIMLTRENGASTPASPKAGLAGSPGAWTPISAAQLQAWVFATARQLRAWSIGKGDRVALLSENRPEWAIADFATLLLGGVVVPIYATQTSEQTLFVSQHSAARIIFVSTRKQYEKIAAIQSETALERIVIMDDAADLPGAIAMQSFLSTAPAGGDAEIEAIARSIEPDDLATLIYTSGTTGTPKGVMLTHGNIASNLSVSLDMFDVGSDDLGISFLPLSHVTARHLDYALMYWGVPIAYCPILDDLPRTLREVHPTIFVGVPRVYEKVYNQVQHKAHGLKAQASQMGFVGGRC